MVERKTAASTRSRPLSGRGNRRLGVAVCEAEWAGVVGVGRDERARLVWRCRVVGSRDTGRESSRREATRLVLGIDMTKRPCDDFREASAPIGRGADHTHGLCLCGWLEEEHGQDRR
jgi:hypothetical protein